MKKFITKKNIRTVSAKTSARGRKIMASTDMSANEMWDILYAITDYRDFDQFEEE